MEKPPKGSILTILSTNEGCCHGVGREVALLPFILTFRFHLDWRLLIPDHLAIAREGK